MKIFSFPFLITSTFNCGRESDVIGPILQFVMAHTDNMIIEMPNGNLNGINTIFTR